VQLPAAAVDLCLDRCFDIPCAAELPFEVRFQQAVTGTILLI
jgi:hypothetical protein